MGMRRSRKRLSNTVSVSRRSIIVSLKINERTTKKRIVLEPYDLKTRQTVRTLFATGHTPDVSEGLLHGEKRTEREEANLPYDRANAPLTGFVLFNLRLTRGEKSGRDYRPLCSRRVSPRE